jgi:two-component system nitrogen regulation sensor histidine kinase NtrY
MTPRARWIASLWFCVLVSACASGLGVWWALAGAGRPTIAAGEALESALLAIVGGGLLGCALATMLGAWMPSERASTPGIPGEDDPLRAVLRAAEAITAGARGVRVNASADGEVGTLVAAVNRMARSLDEADDRLRRAERLAAWRDIARQMAHEIKNPLTPIQMAVELVRKARARGLEDFDALLDEQTTIVLEEVARLRRLVENFSRFARAPRPSVETVSVKALLDHVAAMHTGGEATVTTEVQPGVESLRADREQLTQVLVNLTQNAALAAEQRAARDPERGPARVWLRARSDGASRVILSVQDNGAGVDPSVRERLFEPYVTTRRGHGGTGLGLAIAWRIVHEHDGALSCESSAAGARFDMTLPVEGPRRTETTTTIERQLDGPRPG